MQDLILTYSSQHKEYDSKVPVGDQKTLLNIIQYLIQNPGSGPNGEVTPNDIVRSFLDNFNDPTTAKFYLENY